MIAASTLNDLTDKDLTKLLVGRWGITPEKQLTHYNLVKLVSQMMRQDKVKYIVAKRGGISVRIYRPEHLKSKKLNVQLDDIQAKGEFRPRLKTRIKNMVKHYEHRLQQARLSYIGVTTKRKKRKARHWNIQ